MSDDLDLAAVSARTLASYDARAQDFWAATRDHDVTQNRAALLRWLPAKPATILEFGCGPGRDLKAFRDEGHVAIGLDGAPNFAEMARAYSGCEVWLQDFLRLDLPAAHFDGVYANASLFHVPGQELPRVLRDLHATLKPGGVLFMSNPRGAGEGWRGDRYGAHRELADWRGFLSEAGFTELEHYYRPSNAPPEEQRWLAGVWRR